VFAATLGGVAAAAEIPITFQRVTLATGVRPIRIASGPDGNLWFINAQSSAKPQEQLIGKVTASGEVTTYPITTTQPQITLGAIAAGPDGNLWITYRQSRLSGTGGDAGVVRATTSGQTTFFAVPGNTNPGDAITSGPDGNLWFLDGSNTQAFRVTPQGAGTRFTIPSTGRFSMSITAGPDGNIWFPMGSDIIRMTPSGSATAFPAAAGGFGITAGPDGNLWFSGSVASNKIGRITPGGQVTNFPIPTLDSEPRGIAAGPDGNIWFTEKRSRKIGQLVLSTVSATGASGWRALDSAGIVEITVPDFSDPNTITFTDTVAWFDTGDMSSGGELFKSEGALGEPDLAVSKRGIEGNGSYLYEIVVTNVGTGVAKEVEVVDPLPREFELNMLGVFEGQINAYCVFGELTHRALCRIGSLPPGATKTIYIQGQLTEGFLIHNEATARTSSGERNLSNNTGVFQFDAGGPRIQIEKIASANGWTVEVRNFGRFPTTSPVRVRDPIPSGVTIGEPMISGLEGTSCTAHNGPVECTIPLGFTRGQVVRFFIPIKSKSGSGSVENQAFASGGGSPDAQSEIAVIDTPVVSTVAPPQPATIDGRP
jgi:streptogramin lyase